MRSPKAFTCSHFRTQLEDCRHVGQGTEATRRVSMAPPVPAGGSPGVSRAGLGRGHQALRVREPQQSTSTFPVGRGVRAAARVSPPLRVGGSRVARQAMQRASSSRGRAETLRAPKLHDEFVAVEGRDLADQIAPHVEGLLDLACVRTTVNDVRHAVSSAPGTPAMQTRGRSFVAALVAVQPTAAAALASGQESGMLPRPRPFRLGSPSWTRSSCVPKACRPPRTCSRACPA
jgi:hypothetical protein